MNRSIFILIVLASGFLKSATLMAQSGVQDSALQKSQVSYQFTSGLARLEASLEKQNGEVRLLLKKRDEVLLENQLASAGILLELSTLGLRYDVPTGSYVLSIESNRDMTETCGSDSDAVSVMDKIEIEIGANEAKWRVNSWDSECKSYFSQWSSNLNDEFSYGDAVAAYANDAPSNAYPMVK